jgi:hypothetical protein
VQIGNSYKITGLGNTITPDTRSMLCPSHGASVGLALAAWNGTVLVATGSVAGVTDADRLAVVLSDMVSPDVGITHLTFADAAAVRYATGPTDINVRVSTDFYLPGVTMLADGTILSSLDSLPAVSVYASPQRWLDRLVAGDTYTAINASKLDTYIGAIQQRATVSAKKDDACLESLSLT